MASVSEWLGDNGLGELADLFAAQHIDFETLPDLTEADLRELGLTIGQRRRLSRALSGLRPARPAAPAPAVDPESRPGGAERRHLTVMFCDLVGSTALGERMETEDYLELIKSYRALCHRVVSRYEGFIARFVGDGILCYFGYPVAHENDAERAVRAGLEITRTLGDLAVAGGVRLQARVGISTGVVIIGDITTMDAADPQSVVGVIPNLAARIHAQARPDEVVISESTLRLVRGVFACESLGTHVISGISSPVALWRVRSERALGSRFRASRRAAGRDGMVNRFTELAELRGRWRRCVAGQGGGVVVLGEAGIGKSRLLQHVLDTLEEREALVLRFSGSPFAAASPLQPVIAFLARMARLRRTDGPVERRAKLAALLRGGEGVARSTLPLLSRLLSIPDEDSPSRWTPEQVRDQTFEALIEQLRLIAEVGPVLIAVEDLHWLDPTSLDLLERVLPWTKRLRVFVVATCREGEVGEWLDNSGLHPIRLGHFDQVHARALIRSVLAGRRIDPLLQAQIVDKTDGIPLFLEEVTRAVVEQAAAPLQIRGAMQAAIPASLQETLIARLDQAGPGKDLAQIASVIGRSFAEPLLEAVAGLPDLDVREALDELVRSGLVLREAGGEAEVYSFKHALVQEAAYGGLLRDRRRTLHGRVAEAIEQLTPETRDERPEVLARHFNEAGRPARAAPYWLAAGRRAVDRSAVREAVVLLRQALAAAEALPDSPGTQELRLDILILLGPALMTLVGPGSSEVEDVYSAAFRLCGELPESRRHFPVYWGWWRLSADVPDRDRRFRSLLARAEERQDPELLLQAHHCGWASCFGVADFRACRRHIDAGLAIYEQGDYRSHATLYGGHDAKVCGQSEKALLLWLEGLPEQALAEEEKAFAWARALGHDGSLSHVAEGAVNHHAYRRDPAKVAEHAHTLIRLGEERGFADYLSKGRIFLGWAVSQQGQPARGLALLRQGIAQQKANGTVEDFPMYFSLFADALEIGGHAEEGYLELVGVREMCEKAGLKLWLPEVWRRIGELGRLSGRLAPDEARDTVLSAHRIASEQGARPLALRAVLSLARLPRDDRPLDLVMRLLPPLLDGPAEWLALPDVREAAAFSAAHAAERRRAGQEAKAGSAG
ncbi:MAG: adenylate/guanylate cyclase domain-containing protein [Alsobacter sp.]